MPAVDVGKRPEEGVVNDPGGCSMFESTGSYAARPLVGASSSTGDSRHVVGIDALRFLAAGYVALYHLAFWAWAYQPGMTARASGGDIDFKHLAPVAAYGWIGVQVFFVISGFVIAFSAQRARSFDFFVSRVVRLGPGVWICATVSLLVALAAGHTEESTLFVNWAKSMAFHPFAPWIDTVYWTLCIEISFYAAVLVLLKFGRMDLLRPTMILIGLMSLVFWVAYWLGWNGEHLLLVRAFQTERILELLLVQHGCFFALGVFMWMQWRQPGQPGHRFLMLCFTVAAVLQIAAQAHLNGHRTGIPLSHAMPVLVFLAAMALMWAAVRYNAAVWQATRRVPSLLRTVGLMTFPLYLLHNVAGAALMARLVELGVQKHVALGLTLATAIAAAWVVAMVLEPRLQRLTRRSLHRVRDAFSRRLPSAAATSRP